MEYTYSKIGSIITGKKEKDTLNTLINSNVALPEFVEKYLTVLSDQSSFVTMQSNDVLREHFGILQRYFNVCYAAFAYQSIENQSLENLMEYAIEYRYHTDAIQGVRIATVQEVENGVTELITETLRVIPEQEEKYLNTLLWTFTGLLRYYKAAGLTYEYKDNELKTTKVELITMAIPLLNEMMDWMEDGDNYKNTVDKLKKKKKEKPYVYPSFASDEITEHLSIKHLAYTAGRKYSSVSASDNQRQAKALAFKMEKKGYELLPHEKSIMRKAYKEYQERGTNYAEEGADVNLKKLCQKIETGKAEGYIKGTHFAFRIITTLKNGGYRRCSGRQLAILMEAERIYDVAIANKAKAEKIEEEERDAFEDVISMSDALGTGVYND